MLNMLIVWVISTGLLTSACSVVIVVLVRYLIYPVLFS
jgi:hypothetical protein